MSLFERLFVPRERVERMADAERLYAERPRPFLFGEHVAALHRFDVAIDRILLAAAQVSTSVAPPENTDDPEATE